MKRILLYSACLVSVIVLMASCVKLDTEPAGSTVTETQKNANSAANPELMKADIAALAANLINYTAGSNTHYRFGFAGICMIWDSDGLDMPSDDQGYNHFSAHFDTRTPYGDYTSFMWSTFYSHIRAANLILQAATADATDKTLQHYRGMALANRAWAYFNLVQNYQLTYVGHENELAVPIVTENMPAEQAANNPLATVSSVYELILNDLNEAVTLLEGFSRSDKDQVDQSVAYGIRARVHLVMNKWAEAAADAEQAAAAYKPYSLAEVSKPTFNSASASSWMWANIITEQSRVTTSQIVNFPSMMCSFTGNGYTTLGPQLRYCSAKLFNQIPDTDIRKQWWAQGEWQTDGKDQWLEFYNIDESKRNKNIDWTWKRSYQGYDYNIAEWIGWGNNLLNVKFGPYKDEYWNTINACDFPMMRVEEMHLIQAEAKAMGGDLEGGKQVLENFVKTYRNPDYTCTATSAAEFQDEIWFQRRVELWGEGFSLFDILRLKKDFDRTGSNFPAQTIFKFGAEDPILIYSIPESEINANQALKAEKDKYMRTPTPPKPVANN